MPPIHAPRSRLVAVAAVLATAFLSACQPDVTQSVRPTSPVQVRRDFATTGTGANEADALTISANIQRMHVPFGTVIDPIYLSSDPTSPDYNTQSAQGWGRAADAAIWTGHYLAAEAFRYGATQSPDALNNARAAVSAITTLVDVTGKAGGNNVLARFAIPASSPYATPITQSESQKGIYKGAVNGASYLWLGSTSRDQYSGVLFGLAVAYDMIPDATLQGQIRTTVDRLVQYLLNTGWNVIMPNGSISTTFFGRYDQQLAFLQIARHVDPARFGTTYASYRSKYAGSVGTPISSECTDTYNSYYKFNLDYINLYDLIRLETDNATYRTTYLKAYATLRGCTRTHGNAHFNMVDRGLNGPDATRDAETLQLLASWLQRSHRNYATDVSSTYTACGTNRSCTPVAVNDRPNTDFLWQRTPYLLSATGTGTYETAAIDYILPYWMGRYYGVVTQ